MLSLSVFWLHTVSVLGTMYTIMSFLALTQTSIFMVHAYPSLGVDHLANDISARLEPRQDIPEIPPKPATNGPGSFHGSQFEFLEQTDYAPAVDAMPVWVYSRTQKEFVYGIPSLNFLYNVQAGPSSNRIECTSYAKTCSPRLPC